MGFSSMPDSLAFSKYYDLKRVLQSASFAGEGGRGKKIGEY